MLGATRSGPFQIVEPYTPATVEDMEREDDEDDHDLRPEVAS